MALPELCLKYWALNENIRQIVSNPGNATKLFYGTIAAPNSESGCSSKLCASLSCPEKLSCRYIRKLNRLKVGLNFSACQYDLYIIEFEDDRHGKEDNQEGWEKKSR
jgi:hypothetical protein